MADIEFTVVPPRSGEYANAVVVPDDDEGAIYTESYGSEGWFGHYLGTNLEPGRYKIVKIDD